jgi:hypothetical protein
MASQSPHTREPVVAVAAPVTAPKDTTFDSSTAMSSMYLIFGFLSTMLNCDIQKAMRTSPAILHCMAILAFFFLFTVLDSANNAPLWKLWVKTLSVYALFVMWIKSKFYFSIIALLILAVDQNIKVQISHQKDDASEEVFLTTTEHLTTARKWLWGSAVAVIVVGFVAYVIRQYLEFRGDFSLLRLVFGIGCEQQRYM